MPLTIQTASKSYRAQWLWLAFGLSLIGGAIAINLYVEHRRAESLEEERLSVQARVIVDNAEHQLASANLALENVRSDLVHWKGRAGMQAGIRHLVAASIIPGVRAMTVMDAEGRVYASTRPELIGRDLSYRDYFQEVRRHPGADTLYISPPFKTVLGTFTMNLTRMVPGAHGGFGGIVTATLDPDYFKTLMMSVQYAPDMWVSVAHGDGLLFLMMPERQGVQGMNIMQPGSFFTRHKESGKAAEVLTGTVYATKEVRMMALHTIHPAALAMDKPLVVAVGRDLEAVFQPWRSNAEVQLALFAIIVVASILGLYAYQRRHRKLERLAAEARALADRFSLALDHIPTYIYMKDRQRRYVYANKPTLELFRCTADELTGSVDARFFAPETVAQLHDIDTRILERGEDTTERVVARDADGTVRVYWEVKTPIYEDEAKTRVWGLCGVSTDITELELLKEKLERQAQQDYLTGLCNRRHFLELGEMELSRVQRYGEALSVFMVDIDHFKAVNDSYGHKAGDLVLQRLSEVMKESLRTVDIIGRMGGEEFAVLLPETGLQMATEVAERLREKVEHTGVKVEGGATLHFTISIGVAPLDGRDLNLDILLNQADQALYEAKKGGRNKVCVA